MRPSYDPSGAIFSSFNFMVIFNIAFSWHRWKYADVILYIERTEDRATQTITCMHFQQEHVSFGNMSQFEAPVGYMYRTRAIITRGLYILNPLFEGQNVFSRGFFRKILALCKVSHGGLYRDLHGLVYKSNL